MKNIKTYLKIAALSIFVYSFAGCGKGGINVFSVQNDKELGLQTKAEIEANPGQFPILNPASNAAAYNYLLGIRNDILDAGQIRYKTEFDWEMKIIDDDNTINAFCTPGGYIYVYTGLIKYLDSKSALAGVIGHEMAHADRRHSTTQLTKRYGLQTLLDIVLGNNQSMLTQIASELVSLSFSRSDEKDADTYSVNYLCPSKYRADGAADFFVKLNSQGGSSTPAFLSTHPNPDNRVENIRTHATEKGCSPTISNQEEDPGYAQFKAML